MDKKARIRKGLLLLSSFVFLLLSFNCYAEECGCNQCHGNPPIVNTVGGKNGLAGVGFTAGAHLAHTHDTFGLAQNVICYTCHYNGMPFTPICGNDKLQIGFNINGASGAGTIYNGSATLNDPWTYEGTNGTTITTNGAMSCSNVYCHSNGTGGTINTAPSGPLPAGDPRPVAPSTSPSWTSAGLLPCTSCHGFPPSYPQDQPKSNSHLWPDHMQSCNVCHFGTTTDGQTISNPANHANGIYNVQPDPSANFPQYGGPVSFTYTYDAGGGKCSNISCHGNTNYYWGRVSILATIVPTNGPACYEVQLHSNFSGGTPPYACSWDFGDGTTGDGCSVDHIYQSAGAYSVTLSGRDVNSHPFSSVQSITPQSQNTPATVNESISVSCFTVTLTDLSTDSDADTCGHSGSAFETINWGDGTIATRNVLLGSSPSNAVFTKTYSSASTNTITHTVKDNANATSSHVITGVKVPSTYTISGQVTHTGGAPFSGVQMLLKQGTLVRQQATTDTNGNYSFTNVGCGSYSVTANRSAFTWSPAQVQAVTVPPDQTVNFTANP